MVVAIFDLDNTLIAGDSDHAWGEFLVEKEIVDAKVFKEKNDFFYLQYQRGELDIDAYLSFALEPLARLDRPLLTRLHDEFMRKKIDTLLLPKASALIEDHHRQGHTSLIITSTNSFVAAPIAKLLGVQHFIGSDVEEINGAYTGRPTGIPSYQGGKIKRLNAWLAEQNLSLAGSFGYSDSLNDIPLLEAVEHPVVVDGDEKLVAHATKLGWPCISLRN